MTTRCPRSRRAWISRRRASSKLALSFHCSLLCSGPRARHTTSASVGHFSGCRGGWLRTGVLAPACPGLGSRADSESARGPVIVPRGCTRKPAGRAWPQFERVGGRAGGSESVRVAQQSASRRLHAALGRTHFSWRDSAAPQRRARCSRLRPRCFAAAWARSRRKPLGSLHARFVFRGRAA